MKCKTCETPYEVISAAVTIAGCSCSEEPSEYTSFSDRKEVSNILAVPWFRLPGKGLKDIINTMKAHYRVEVSGGLERNVNLTGIARLVPMTGRRVLVRDAGFSIEDNRAVFNGSLPREAWDYEHLKNILACGVGVEVSLPEGLSALAKRFAVDGYTVTKTKTWIRITPSSSTRPPEEG